MNEIQTKLSADPGAMILGIIALLISLVGCCCGILAIPAVIMSIIGLVWANKSLKIYELDPNSYNPRSFSSVKSAKVVNIIALALSAVALVVSLIWFGTLLSNPENIFEQLENGDFNTTIDDYEDETITKDEVDTWKYEDTTDSTQVDQPVELDPIEDSI